MDKLLHYKFISIFWNTLYLVKGASGGVMVNKLN